MPTGQLTVAQLRRRLPELLGQLELSQRRYLVIQNGRPCAVLIGLADLARLETLDEDEAALNIKPPHDQGDPCEPAEGSSSDSVGVDALIVDGYVRLRPEVPDRFRTRLGRGRDGA